MKHPTSVTALLLLALCIFSWLQTSISQEVEVGEDVPLEVEMEVDDEREFDYIKGSNKGPEYWGDLKEEWAACKKGEMQSPIDMSNERVTIVREARDIRRKYFPSPAIIKNRGHDISIQWPDLKAGRIRINGTRYLLQQGHWHSPSEHTINGRRFDLELHMVHVTSDPQAKYKIAVITVLYKIGLPDPFLSKLIGNITTMNDQLEEKTMGVIDPNEIKARGREYYRYIGSLTVPPCSEGVIWTIYKRLSTVSRDQVKALRLAVHDYAEENARPVQALNDRTIKLYSKHDPPK